MRKLVKKKQLCAQKGHSVHKVALLGGKIFQDLLKQPFLQKLLVSSHVNQTVAAEVEEDYLFAALFFGF